MAECKNVSIAGTDIFYRESGGAISNPKATVVLLHGMRFSSKNWEEIGTLQRLAERNYRAVAVDLPGYGNSGKAVEPQDRGKFVADVFKALKIPRAIVISPSMSGKYSLELLHNYSGLVQGYVPIAPINTNNYTVDQYKKVKTPTFIVYGKNDTMLGSASLKHLSQIPGHKVYVMNNAGHACYLDQTDMWHQNLDDILQNLAAV